ncbi:MAG: glycosyltransferase [Bryobacteraceae bacterium]|jgi:hopene-associated glycosyltransferase HpnB
MAIELAAYLALAIWVYLVVARGGFWLEKAAVPPRLDASRKCPSVVAVVPARNEALVVEKAIGSLAGQRYPGAFHIVLVDDSSSDGTAEAARAVAPAERLSVIRAEPLAAGWTGKMWAVAQGVRYAARFEADYFLLTDADIVHAPDNLAGLAARAEGSGYQLVSYMATLECRTLPERALIPAFVFFFFLLYPPRWIRNPRRRTAGAAGGCMLVERKALESSGGIEAIGGALIDDCSLAAQIKNAGGRLWLGLSPATHSIRRYGRYGEIGQMISRGAFTQLRHSALLLLGTTAGLALTYLGPPLAAALGRRNAALAGALAWGLMSAAYAPMLRFYRKSALWAPLMPLIATFYLCATMHSAMVYWRGKGGRWKGRVQDG